MYQKNNRLNTCLHLRKITVRIDNLTIVVFLSEANEYTISFVDLGRRMNEIERK